MDRDYRPRVFLTIRPIIITAAVIALVFGGLSTGPRPVAEAKVLTADVQWQAQGGSYESEEIQADLNTIGLTWEGDAPLTAWFRTRVLGTWGPWNRLPVSDDHGPDPGTDEYANSIPGSDPVWVGDSEAVQFRMTGPTARAATAVLIDTKDRSNPVLREIGNFLVPRMAPANGAPQQPLIEPRSTWDPGGQCVPRDEPDEVQITHFFVHHTTGSNTYSEAEALDRVLGVCLFHVNTRGWDDIAYNFLIDKYGNIYEGRAGGIEKGIQGAHTAGFSTYSVGVAFIGDHESTAPTTAAEDALEALIAWKASVHNVDASTFTTIVSKGSAKFEQGTPVSLHAISAHLDAQLTSCPGTACYQRLPSYRSAVSQQWSQVPLSTYVSPLIGDFDGDGSDEAAIFRTTDGQWLVTETNHVVSTWSDFSTAKGWAYQLVGDYDGDGRDDIANFHPSTGKWMVSESTGNSFTTRKWATFKTKTGWTSLIGDYNGDGRDDIANFHPSTGKWMVSESTGNSFTTRKWATFKTKTGWTSLVGDYNGDGRDDIANYHPSTGNWMIAESTGNGFTTRKWATFNTKTGWTSVVGDYTGDDRDDIANYHPSTGKWMVSESIGNSFTTRKWATYGSLDHWSHLWVQDFDGNGEEDLIGFDAYNGFIVRFGSNGNSFAPANVIDTPWRTTLDASFSVRQNNANSWVFFNQEFSWIQIGNLDDDSATATLLPGLPRE